MVKWRGFTIQEVLVSMAIFSAMMIVLLVCLSQASTIWRRSSGMAVAQHQLARASEALSLDLRRASWDELAAGPGPASLSAAPDGSAIWFLSAVDPATGQSLRKADGSPFWQCNILYYAVVPALHDQTFGMTCAGGAGPNGLDDRCPHKVLVRKVIDSGPPTIPADETTEETLLGAGPVTAYLTRPQGYDLSSLATEPGVRSVELRGNSLLLASFRRAPDPAVSSHEVELDLRALIIPAARRELAVGQVSLADNPFTIRKLLSVFPQN